jgi:glycosyltransferase involved in cell wall biosynthesis
MHFSPDIIIHEFNPSILSLHTSFVYSRIFRKKFIVWGHGYNREIGFDPKHSFKSKIRFWYMKKADALLVYGQDQKSELSAYISSDKIFVAQNTLDTNLLTTIRKSLEKKGVETIKKELNINNKYNLIYIGRLLKSKYPEKLIQLYALLPKNIAKTLTIHIIGEGEMFNELNDEIRKNEFDNNIILYGKIDDPLISGKYLFISDLVIIPGALGLSVNHAFCFYKPIMSFKKGSDGPFHGPEIEYVVQNKTGFLAENSDLNEMCNFILDYLCNDNMKIAMKREIKYIIENIASIKNMELGIQQSVEFVSKL